MGFESGVAHMSKTFFGSLQRASLCASAVALLSLFSVTAAHAQAATTLEGCNPAVEAAQKAVAEVKVAKYVADAEQVITQPESANAITCFNQQAGISASQGGAIFSGDFSNDLAPVVTASLNSYYDDFADTLGMQSFLTDLGLPAGTSSQISSSLLGGLASAVDTLIPNFGFNLPINFGNGTTVQGIVAGDLSGINYNTGLQNQSECNGIKGLWDKVQGKGINKMVPQMSLKDLLKGPTAVNDLAASMPGLADSKFMKNWQANDSNNIFQNARNAVDGLPQATITPVNGYASADSSCEVLKLAQILPATTVCPQ